MLYEVITPIHPLSLIATTFFIGTALLLPVYLWEHAHVRAIRPDATTLAVIAYVAIFPSILSYLCFNRGVELIGANRAGLFIHLMPVFGSIVITSYSIHYTKLYDDLRAAEPAPGACFLALLAGTAP